MMKLSKRMQRILAKVQRDRKGAISIIAAMSMTAVMGLAGLGTEVAYWYVKERDMQAAADSAAIAGAAAVMSGDTATNIGMAANTGANQYGFTGTGNGCGTSSPTVVAVHNPPSAGGHTSDNNAVEVVICQVQKRAFSALFMPSDPTFSTRAVATQIPTNPACVVTLDHASLLAQDLTTSGTTNVSMPNCDVFVDSCDKTTGAMVVSGNASFTMKAAFVCGDYRTNGGGSLTGTVHEDTGTSYQDPYQGTSVPPFSGCDQATNGMVVNSHPSGPLQPGVYCGGLTINGSAGNVDLAPGTYIMNGSSTNSAGFQVNATANVTCSACQGTDNTNGVTIVLTGSGSSVTSWASVQINGSATVDLNAPLPGASSGVPPFLFYQDPHTPLGGSSQINGNSNTNLAGAMYFPTQLLKLNGNSTVAGTCTQYVVYQIQFSGTNAVNSTPIDCENMGIKSLNAPGGTSIALVE